MNKLATILLSLSLGVTALAFAQEPQHEEAAKPEAAKPAKQTKAPKAAKQPKQSKEDKAAAKQSEKDAKGEKPSAGKPKAEKAQKNEGFKGQKDEQKNENGGIERETQQNENGRVGEEPKHENERVGEEKQNGAGGHGRIPEDRYKSNFGESHKFHVSEGDFRNHRFAYGGYNFGFVGEWPSDWLYTQDVYVCMVDDTYFLCNPMYPGVTVAIEVEE